MIEVNYPNVLRNSPNANNELINFNIEVEITRVLKQLGIRSDINGYTYLKAIVIKVIKDPSLKSQKISDLYSLIADEYKTTESRISRSIRWVISNFKFKDVKLAEALFGDDYYNVKITNKLLILSLIELITQRMQINSKIPNGWICKKCGKSLSPQLSTCTFC